MTCDAMLIAVFSAVTAALCCTVGFLLLHIFRIKKTSEETKKQTDLLLSTAAHDLRSPLASIKSHADALLDGTLPEDKKEESLALISAEADRLARITARLSGNSQIRYGVFDVCEHMRRVALLLEKKISAKNISLSFSFSDNDEFYVNADSDAVFEIIWNVFENAVKYCPDGGNIAVSVKNEGQTVKIAVKNSAVAAIDTGNIFEAGKRGSDTSQKGFGLGLFICSELLRVHNKKATVISDSSQFELSFELDAADEFAE